METLPIISKDCSESDFIRIVRDVAKLEHDCKLWLADAALWAINRWGKEKGLQLLHEATGLKKCSLYHAHYTAKAFPPQKRFDYNYNSLRFMKPYANANAPWTDAFLERHQADKVSSRDLRALAQKEYAGKDGEKKKPVHCRSPKKCSVTIRTDLFARLRLHCPDRPISILVSEICESWIAQQPNAPAVKETKKVKRARAVSERRAERQKAREEKEAVKAAKQKVKEEKAAAEQKLREEKAAALAEKRETYEQRRLAQLAAGAQRIAAKQGRPRKTHSLRRQWLECAGPVFVDGEEGAIKVKDGKHQATRFKTEEAAIQAEQQFFKQKNFHEDIVFCGVCRAWHVRHRWQGEGASQTINRPLAAPQVSP